ncbi:MAG: aconitase/3-isopropylmalate dehydratase large subunit family protein [Bacteroidales bacterium]|nr:aconitase/3-isopropylmalate dehydratase large subunit family protein [Bacteroidales bacterium]
MPSTFVEKIFRAPAGSIVFHRPDLILTHDNTGSIRETFEKMGGQTLPDPDQLVVVLDHNAPPTSAALANTYQSIRDFVAEQGVKKFHDAGSGICHQLMARYAKPGMVILGSDSHTCTSGAFNVMAAGIDRTEAAGLWLRGETWFRVPESMKITLTGRLKQGVYAKDLSLWIIGILGSAGANYMSIEYHGEAVRTLNISDRMTLANLASEMGAKNAVFPADQVLNDFLGEEMEGVWADEGAAYQRELEIDLGEVFPLVAAPHHVDHVKGLSEVSGLDIHQGMIGTCTNGRIEDLREAAAILKNKKVKTGVQLLVIPASREIYQQAIEEGLITIFLEAGANVLSSSCGPCLGTGQGIPADHMRVISSANRNFLGRMGNKNAEIYLASPAAVALSVIHGKITDPRIADKGTEKFPFRKPQPGSISIEEGDRRRKNGVWNYGDIDNLNTDQMFAGNLTYEIQSSDPEAILPHLFKGFDPGFAEELRAGDIILGGDNFGCGSSREHPAVGLAHKGVKAVIVKSVNRIFYRAAVNQGLALIVLPRAVVAYQVGDPVGIDFAAGIVEVGKQQFGFEPLPGKLLEILEMKGLVNWIRNQ